MTSIASRLLLCLLLASSAVMARDFERITIPGALCGNGSPYTVWLEKKKSDRLIVEFMGGGVCWSAKTCFGPKLRTWIFPIPTLPAISWTSNDLGPKREHGPMSDASMIYVPYCNGDVHAGRHSARYHGIEVHHHGHKNVERALAYLQEQGLIDYKQFKEVVMTGSSAGAIGALAHSVTIAPYLAANARKVLLLDAPGMHFGERFWDKFPLEMIADFQSTFSKMGVQFTAQDHNLAAFLPQLSKRLKDWRIGILQGARDVVMSHLFGDISPSEHREMLYGEQGAHQQSLKTGNVSVWLPDTYQHTFLLSRATASIHANQLSAAEFSRLIIEQDVLWHERQW